MVQKADRGAVKTKAKAKTPAKRKSRAKPKSEHKKPGKPMKVLSAKEMGEIEKLATVLTKDQLANYFGMSKTTFQEIEKRQPEVSDLYKRGRAKAIAGIAGNLVNKARAGNITAQIFFLKTQAGWKETSVVQNENKDVKTFADMYGDT